MGVHRKVRGDAQDAGSRMRGVLGRPSLLAIQFPQLTPLTLRTPFPAATSLLSLLATSPLLTLHLSLFDDEEIHDAPITPSLHAIPSHSPSPMLHQRGLGHNSHRRDEMAASFLRPQRNPSRTRWGSGAHTPIPSSRKAPSSPTRAHRGRRRRIWRGTSGGGPARRGYRGSENAAGAYEGDPVVAGDLERLSGGAEGLEPGRGRSMAGREGRRGYDRNSLYLYFSVPFDNSYLAFQ